MAEPFKIPDRKGPEWHIQQRIIRKLMLLQWHVIETHGNMYQRGLPDLFCCHRKFGHRWVEVKNPKAYQFTAAQLENFPQLCSHGSGVWVLVDDTDLEVRKLMGPPNWQFYIK